MERGGEVNSLAGVGWQLHDDLARRVTTDVDDGVE
jgi:hypothetical protein